MTWVATAAVVTAGVMTASAQKAAGTQAGLNAEYDAQVAENEKILLARNAKKEEKRLRQGSERLISSQRVAAAKSGVVTGTGSNLLALRDAYMGTEMDLIELRFASSVQQQNKTAQAAMIRLGGKARKSAANYQSYATLLGTAGKAYGMSGGGTAGQTGQTGLGTKSYIT
tara:strand:- start:13 stop:522 length:510 start_codon:yes stop_codon:yes gene_type:complete